ncbi:MAG: hypothetical protein IPF59_14060 [Ignavibacteria bacterium]|nr:hypothetical protein [Ignavibacteria bacterium]
MPPTAQAVVVAVVVVVDLALPVPDHALPSKQSRKTRAAGQDTVPTIPTRFKRSIW